ncbi:MULTISPECIES: winged helix-turn-helix domain-containing protein [Streptomyces]|uniref:Helix-turn-helix transcriptional regulator n=1 Tax=Streptomyces morookaense TaxID=1970 RepID=A0A7Y7E6P8_STRMO|nr:MULTISPECIES: helix-turn-helix domain-containing protein [Streptomyces]MCC2278065.1 helix-turn-helix domain-containing protein [Streptomyces sp. ET3-23]NVK77387.1 helix-turn-helix transcriptional regulator [Streptomyces morookaense]GHF21444.1 transcriptional regulator [Streptomyces morookaense]
MTTEHPPHDASLRPDPATDAVLDAKGLRALAHPLRVQLVSLLRTHGPSTATRLAERLGVGSGVTSYHLRQLGAAGFVEEDPERGNARERWWKAAHRATWFSDKELMDQEPEATAAYLGSIATLHALRTQLALSNMPFMPRPWRHTLGLSDHRLFLTPEETERLKAELREVISRYRTEAPEDAEQVLLVTHFLPEPETLGEDPS